MVSAFKSNQTTTKLDDFIEKFAVKHKEKYVFQKKHTIRKAYMDESVQKLSVNSIIEGYFPKENLIKDMAIKRVNKSLSVILAILVTVVVISYYFVLSSEMKLNDLSRQTVILNNENEELQIKLDSLKSFNNVDKTLQQNNMLQRAGQVIETPEIVIEKEKIHKNSKSKRVFNYAIGF